MSDERCPTCRSDSPEWDGPLGALARDNDACPDPFHSPVDNLRAWKREELLKAELTRLRERVEELESLLGKALAFIPPPHPRFQGPGAPLMTQVIHALDRPLNPDTQEENDA